MPATSYKPVILLAFANDEAGTLRNLAEEARRLRESLRPAELGGLCEVVVRQNATLDDIWKVFHDPAYHGQVAIFHYGGHANGYQLLFEAAGGGHAPADAAGFAAFLGTQSALDLIFLNGCSTQPQAQGLLDAGVAVVIATAQAIDDAVATEFASQFYAALAAGDALRTGYDAAAGAVRAAKGGSVRDLLSRAHRDAVPDPRLPWDIAVRPGAETAERWSLPAAAGDPLFGLPPLPPMDLPPSPYRHLDGYRREDAEVFFGRGREIRDLFGRITAPGSAPIVLFYGQSGAGKSSLLAAGLTPRLERDHAVRYVRRDQSLGLLGTLRAAVGTAVSATSPGDAAESNLATAWAAVEVREGRPLVVVLDQVEEAYTRPGAAGAEDEIAALLAGLQTVFATPERRPRGKLVLSFRKEWLAEIEKRFAEARLPRSTEFLDRLDRAGIVEVVAGPARSERLRHQYGLTIAGDLPGLIADDMLADPGSAVAPTLQILLGNLYDRARKRDHDHPTFDRALCDILRAEGLGLGDFLDNTLTQLQSRNAEVVGSGLALDVLAHHTTPLGTAEECTRAALAESYPHRAADVLGLVQACEDLYLLVDPARTQPDQPPASRLAHDTLAPLVRQRYDTSDRPGQRARRILEGRTMGWTGEGESPTGRSADVAPLDEVDLAAVEGGAGGMRGWTAVEGRLVEASRAARVGRRRRRKFWSGIGVVALLAIIATSAVAVIQGRRAQRQVTISRARELAAQSQTVREQDPVGSLLLAVEAVSQTAQLTNEYGVVRIASADQALIDGVTTIGGQVLSGHKDSVNVVAFSTDGRWLATGSDDNTARLWDVTNPAAEPWVLHGHESSVNGVAFSPNGRWLATGSGDLFRESGDHTVRLWDVTDHAAEPRVLRGHEDFVRAIAFSPDGRLLATGSGDDTIRLWDVTDLAAEPRVLRGHEDFVRAVAFSPDGRLLASGSGDDTVRLWSVIDPAAEPRVLRGHEDNVDVVKFSPDGGWLATGTESSMIGIADHTVRLWDVGDPTAEPRVLRGHGNSVLAAAFSPDGRWLATGSADLTARLWDLTNPAAEPRVFRGFLSSLLTVAFSPDGRWLATGSAERTARLWDLANPGSEPRLLRGHEDFVTSVAFSPDGRRLATGSGDNTARLWDVGDPTAEPRVLRGHQDLVSATAFSPDGRLLATWGGVFLRSAEDYTVWLWDMINPANEPRVLRGHERSLLAASFSSDGRWLATGSSDNTARLWDVIDPTNEPRILRGHESWVNAVAFSPDGRWLATGSGDTTARLWDMIDPTNEPRVLRGHGNSLLAVAFSPDGRWLATGSSDNTARLWDVIDSTNEPRVLRGHESWVNAVAFSPDGRWLATGSGDTTARLWDMIDPTNEPRGLRGQERSVTALAFSPDGRWLATGGSYTNTAHLWDVIDPGAEPRVLRGYESGVSSVAFSPDGRWLATGSSKTAQLWDVIDSGTEPRVLRGHAASVLAVAFSPDGRWLATGSYDNTARLWDLEVGHLVQSACLTAGRNLTLVEWKQYFPNESYRRTCPDLPIHPSIPGATTDAESAAGKQSLETPIATP